MNKHLISGIFFRTANNNTDSNRVDSSVHKVDFWRVTNMLKHRPLPNVYELPQISKSKFFMSNHCAFHSIYIFFRWFWSKKNWNPLIGIDNAELRTSPLMKGRPIPFQCSRDCSIICFYFSSCVHSFRLCCGDFKNIVSCAQMSKGWWDVLLKSVFFLCDIQIFAESLSINCQFL